MWWKNLQTPPTQNGSKPRTISRKGRKQQRRARMRNQRIPRHLKSIAYPLCFQSAMTTTWPCLVNITSGWAVGSENRFFIEPMDSGESPLTFPADESPVSHPSPLRSNHHNPPRFLSDLTVLFVPCLPGFQAF